MAYRILIVDDENELQNMVKDILTQAGYETDAALSCAQAMDRFQAGNPNAVLLDINLPDGDGFSLFRQFRESRDVPILFLSARDEDADRLRGLGLGADDYITKPFLPQELLLRLRSVLRRVYREAPDAARLGNAEINWGKGIVRRNGVETALTAKEFALLKKLWDAQSNIVTIDALCDTLWDGPVVGYENTLMVHIRRLRGKDRGGPLPPQVPADGTGFRLPAGAGGQRHECEKYSERFRAGDCLSSPYRSGHPGRDFGLHFLQHQRPGWECIYPGDLRRPHLGRDGVFLLWGGPFG